MAAKNFNTMARPNGVFKKDNQYMKNIDPAFYVDCPKAVFAAIAASYALNYIGSSFENLTAELHNEWATLHRNGIVDQKPPKIKTQS